jgi:ketosteroid isomerase-like protein
MSQENVDALRRMLDAFNRGDRTAWLASLDERYEMVPIGDWPDARAIRGGEAAWDFYRDVAQTLGFEMRAYMEFVDASADKVVGHQRHGAHGRRSGADVEVDFWLVSTFREGKIVRDEWFTDRAEALEAAGLEE